MNLITETINIYLIEVKEGGGLRDGLRGGLQAKKQKQVQFQHSKKEARKSKKKREKTKSKKKIEVKATAVLKHYKQQHSSSSKSLCDAGS